MSVCVCVCCMHVACMCVCARMGMCRGWEKTRGSFLYRPLPYSCMETGSLTELEADPLG